MAGLTKVCSNCGKSMDAIVSTCPHCGKLQGVTRRPATTGKKVGLGIVVFILAALIVIGAPLAVTYYKYMHPDIGSGGPQGRSSGGGAALGGVQGGAPAYAVADVVSGTDADRAKMNGQSVVVEGVVVDTATVGGKPALVLADSLTGYSKGSAKNVTLNIAPPQASLKAGKKAKVAGIYDAKSNTLKLTGVTPE